MAARKNGKRVLWLVLIGLGIAAWKLGPRWLEKRAGTERLANQVWVGSMPRDERDMVGFVVLLEREGKRQGVFGRASRWRSRTEGCVWALDGNQLRARFPQDQQTTRGRVRTWRCAGEAPSPFEWCLEIAHGDHPHRYYSRDNWRVRPQDGALEDSDARAEISWLAPLRPMDGLPLEELSDEAEASDGLRSPLDDLAP